MGQETLQVNGIHSQVRVLELQKLKRCLWVRVDLRFDSGSAKGGTDDSLASPRKLLSSGCSWSTE